MYITIAKSINKLVRIRSVVINGACYMDEASLAGENHLVLLESGELTEITITPADVGLPTYNNKSILGGDAKTNANILNSILNNEPSAYLDTVLLNDRLALFANGHSKTIIEGINETRQSIQTGT